MTTSLQQITGNMTDIHPCQVILKRRDTTAEIFHLKWAPGDILPWKTNQDCPFCISFANQTRISHISGEILQKQVFFALTLFSSPEVTNGQKYPTYNQWNKTVSSNCNIYENYLYIIHECVPVKSEGGQFCAICFSIEWDGKHILIWMLLAIVFVNLSIFYNKLIYTIKMD